jgi:hypothetical protein
MVFLLLCGRYEAVLRAPTAIDPFSMTRFHRAGDSPCRPAHDLLQDLFHGGGIALAG